MRRALVLGGAGFIGRALVRKLYEEHTAVRSIDIRLSRLMLGPERVVWDLRQKPPSSLFDYYGDPFDEVYQLAADVGGAGYIYSGENDAEIVSNNTRINLNVAEALRGFKGRVVFASSACVYSGNHCYENASVIWPETVYGREKLFAETLYRAHDLNLCVARFSTIYGPGDGFDGGREKAVAAICRKVIDAEDGGTVEVWGDGSQTRPLLYIDDLVDGIIALARADIQGPMKVNLATRELTTCNQIAALAIVLSGKKLTIKNVPGPVGQHDVKMSTILAKSWLGWQATTPFAEGVKRTYDWIAAKKKLQTDLVRPW